MNQVKAGASILIASLVLMFAQTAFGSTSLNIPDIKGPVHNFDLNTVISPTVDSTLIRKGNVAGCIELVTGNILLNQNKDIGISVNEGKIDVGGGSIVLIMQSEQGTIIYDLLQTRSNQVSVVIKTQKVFIEPGQMLVLTNQNIDDFEKLALNCHSIRYHNAKSLQLLNNEVHAYSAEFSIASALVTIDPLKHLLHSNNKQDKLTLERMIKNIVILQARSNRTI